MYSSSVGLFEARRRTTVISLPLDEYLFGSRFLKNRETGIVSCFYAGAVAGSDSWGPRAARDSQSFLRGKHVVPPRSSVNHTPAIRNVVKNAALSSIGMRLEGRRSGSARRSAYDSVANTFYMINPRNFE